MQAANKCVRKVRCLCKRTAENGTAGRKGANGDGNGVEDRKEDGGEDGGGDGTGDGAGTETSTPAKTERGHEPKRKQGLEQGRKQGRKWREVDRKESSGIRPILIEAELMWKRG